MLQLDIEGDLFAKPVGVFEGLPYKHFSVLSADPAWTFLTRSEKGKGRSAEKHYACLTIEEIKALPVSDLAAPDSVLFLWVTDPHLAIGLEVMDAWGFTYKTVAFTWAKLQLRIEPEDDWTEKSFFTGMGYWSRANPEMCLLGTRGHPKRLHKDVRQLIVSPRREHSRKPDEAYQRMRRLVDGPAIELFARTAREGWISWGNETDRF
jgi:N6-adenosine-specific RNA methylase IME4